MTVIPSEARFLLVLWSSLCGFPFDHNSRSWLQEGSKSILLHYKLQAWISRPSANNQTLHSYSFVRMNSFGNKMCVSLKRSHPILAVPATLLIPTDISNNGGYLSRYVKLSKYLLLAGFHPWPWPSSRLLYNDRSLQPFQSALLSSAGMATVEVYSSQKFQFKYLY